jgi:hypothetical protein
MTATPTLPDYRTVSIIAGALMASVVVYWVLVEIIARLTPMRPPFPGDNRWATGALAASLVPLVIAGVVRRRLSSAPGQAPARVLTSCIMAWAFAEVPAIFGLIAFLMTGMREAAYGPIALSLFAHALLFPRRSQWEEWTRLSRPA